MIMIGVYYIKNKINNKIYIGSSKDIYTRKSQHYSELRGNYHTNIILQRSWNKYGEDSFEFGILEETTIENRFEIEQKYINKYYDGGVNCYNLNKYTTEPPVHKKPCALYNLNGELLRVFDSIRECANYLNLNETTVKGSISRDNSVIKNKYMVESIKGDEIVKKIKRYSPTNLRYIYLLNEDNSISKEFSSISSLCIFLNGKRDKTEETKISSCLNFVYKYKNSKIIYKSDYENFKGYFDKDLHVYKYILKYDLKGKLLEVIENKYGLKFRGSQADNCKINTRLKSLHRNIFRVYNNEYIYLRSDEILGHIETNIIFYIVYDIESGCKKEFVKAKNLYKYMGITKSKFEYHFYSNKLYKDKYLFFKEEY